ncbi:MAG TPA: hypothetical protein DC031_12335 [Sulfitobacter sp.]|nr:hypothetical protein [Sulfitobacter sp.]HBB84033.1 hypothetical protein [Sulfitobacter sp.]
MRLGFQDANSGVIYESMRTALPLFVPALACLICRSIRVLAPVIEASLGRQKIKSEENTRF